MKLRYKAWQNASRDKNADELLTALEEAESKFRRRPDVSFEFKIKNLMMVADAQLRHSRFHTSTPRSVDELRSTLRIAEELATNIEEKHSTYKQLRFYVLQLAILDDDQSLIESESNWIVANAQGTNYEKSALIQLAKLADDQIQSAVAPTSEQIENTIARFEILSQRLGDSESALKSNSNARVTYLRLAELHRMNRNFAESRKILNRLNQTFPKHVIYLRQLALTQTQSGDYESAMIVWKTLVSGVPAGSDEWFECKYNLAICLANTNHTIEARKLLEQTIRLGGDIPEKWSQLIEDQLEKIQSAGKAKSLAQGLRPLNNLNN